MFNSQMGLGETNSIKCEFFFLDKRKNNNFVCVCVFTWKLDFNMNTFL